MSVAVSVLVPFHNAETTLEKALESLAAQKCDGNVQYILINDGSTDRSEEIVAYFCAINPQFEKKSILISYPFRQGVAAAISLGITNATGEYLARLDADDTFEPDALANLLQCARTTGADIVCGSVNKIIPGKKTKILSPSNHFGDLNRMPLDTINFSLWNKVIRKDLLVRNEIMPVNGIDCWDDVSILSRVLPFALKTAVLDKPVYNYTVDNAVTSLSNTSHDLALRQRLMCTLLVEKWFVEKGIAAEYEPFILLMKFHAKVKLLRGGYCDITKWRETYPEVNAHLLDLKQLPLPVRLGFYILDKLPKRIAVPLCRFIDKRVKR
ncbi:MAG: glycosyltransferase [Paramuribaculum sp.]|nr:glycosyltransferase [Paramuribaculum sp.]